MVKCLRENSSGPHQSAGPILKRSADVFGWLDTEQYRGKPEKNCHGRDANRKDGIEQKANPRCHEESGRDRSDEAGGYEQPCSQTLRPEQLWRRSFSLDVPRIPFVPPGRASEVQNLTPVVSGDLVWPCEKEQKEKIQYPPHDAISQSKWILSPYKLI